jgi:hypothetical protein
MCKFKQSVSDTYSKAMKMAATKDTEVLDNFPLFWTTHKLMDTQQKNATERNNYRSNNVWNKSTPVYGHKNACSFYTVFKFS